METARPIEVSYNYFEAIQLIAGTQDRLKWLVETRRRFLDDRETYDFFSGLIKDTASALSKLRIAAGLDTEKEWEAQKAIYDNEQMFDMAGTTA